MSAYLFHDPPGQGVFFRVNFRGRKLGVPQDGLCPFAPLAAREVFPLPNFSSPQVAQLTYGPLFHLGALTRTRDGPPVAVQAVTAFPPAVALLPPRAEDKPFW